MTFASINMILNGSSAVQRGVASLVQEMQTKGFSATDYCMAYAASADKRVTAGTMAASSAKSQYVKIKRIVSATPNAVADAWGAGNCGLNTLGCALPKTSTRGRTAGAKNVKGTKASKAAPATAAQTIGDNDGPGLTLGKLAIQAAELRASLPKWTANQALLNAYDAYLVLLKAEAKAQQG